MPQGENFWNPYRMIPVRNEEPLRSSPKTHESFKGLSGHIVCKLTTLTPFLIGKSSDDKKNDKKTVNFVERCGKPVIPGTSLKGMIRSLAELHRKCTENDKLCITCRMFGMLEKEKVFMGNVSFSDGIFSGSTPQYNSFRITVGSPKASHESFYKNPLTGRSDKKVRKAYFHQPRRVVNPTSAPPNQRNNKSVINVNSLRSNVEFEFTTTFYNLEAQELSLLLYCLALENSTSVELGKGRLPLKGALRHKPQKMVVRDMKARYSGQASENIFEGTDIENEIEKKTKRFRADNSYVMVCLRKMLIWDEGDTRDFKYPAFDWFKVREEYGGWVSNPANSRKSLKDI